MKQVVITGSQGSLGSILQEGLQELFSLVLVDVKDGKNVTKLDLTKDYKKLRNLIKSHDTIVHFAWDTKEDYPNENIILDNKIMAENVYRAAVEAGVKRVIIASSVHANDYSKAKPGDDILATVESFPDTPYGATKNYIESLGRFYAKKYNMEVICIRFGGVNKNDEIRFNEDPSYDKVLLYKEDFINLITLCINIKKVPNNFTLLYGISNVPERVHSLKNFFNWQPKKRE